MKKEIFREMDVINKYYDVDKENKIVTIPLHYDKASDLVDHTVRTKGEYFIDPEEIAKIGDKVRSIPLIYKTKISLQIDDYEGYSPTKLLANINDCLELSHYQQDREIRLNRVIAIFLLVVGISIIVLNVTLKELGFYKDVAYEILDIVSWVFIWEATTVAFLRPSEITINSKKMVKRISGIELLDKDLKIVASEDSFNNDDEWKEPTKAEKFAKALLLYAGGALIAASAISIISSIPLFFAFQGLDTGEQAVAILITIALELIVYSLMLLAGISSITTYLGRGPFRKWAKYVFLVAIGVLFALEAYSISSITKENLFSEILLATSALFYVIGIVMTTVITHKETKEMKEKEEE